eukprot:5971722-Pleurochrysis_carterae.AAC.1
MTSRFENVHTLRVYHDVHTLRVCAHESSPWEASQERGADVYHDVYQLDKMREDDDRVVDSLLLALFNG